MKRRSRRPFGSSFVGCLLLSVVSCTNEYFILDGSSGGSANDEGGTGAAPASGGETAGGGAPASGATGGDVNIGPGSGGALGGFGGLGGTNVGGGSSSSAIPEFDTSIDSSTLTFQWANATNYTSYPDPGSEECIVFNGCEWAGYFAAVDGQQTEEWVEAHNIVAFFSAGDGNTGFDTYALKRLRLRKNGAELDVIVYDTCGDSDCDGCCTQNATQNGYATLIDLESYTYARFGQGDGPIEWACLD
jgi:hypothetical protein